ncbi:MAG: magnesium chelatase subunit [Miltoncostaeaceae bacterium]|nr:magnesium chelatase subunit [Miltoncostaeaceae bacterium]
MGQEELRLALLATAVSPQIGGVLVRGERGTAKSTAVRALARLLPPLAAVAGCPFACDPAAADPSCPAGPHPPDAPAERRPARLVELPVGASVDRVAGSLDLERALVDGVRAFEPGLLAAANRGLLYVDEVNLLPDHLVDLLLDAAALGVNHVEREGVSVRHAARFMLVGTMNPEEGDLRPQLLDRFGLGVDVRTSRDPAERGEVVRRQLAFEADPAGFTGGYAADEAALAEQVRAARALLPSVRLPDRALARITGACARLAVEGLRADIVAARTARALAALEGRDEAADEDVRRALMLALAHRRRRGPLEQPGLEPEELDRALQGEGDEDEPPPRPPRGGPNGRPSEPARADRATSPAPAVAGERTDRPEGEFRAPRLRLPDAGAGAPGRRSPARGELGRPAAERQRPPGELAPAATLRAAAPAQATRGRHGPGLVLRRGDLRWRLREGREGNLVVLVVDASGSMGARRRMRAVKGALMALLVDAYQRRDRIAVVGFRDDRAEVLVAPSARVEHAAERLGALPTGGRTPLAAGLARAHALVRAERLRDPRRRALVVLVTDGRANAGPDALGAARAAAVALARDRVALAVIDTEDGPARLGLAAALADAAGAGLLRLDELAA